jgi:hypothetical protein
MAAAMVVNILLQLKRGLFSEGFRTVSRSSRIAGRQPGIGKVTISMLSDT